MNKIYKTFETYTDSSVHRISIILDEMIKDIQKWFTDGKFSDSYSFYDKIEKSSMTTSTERFVMFDFFDDNYYYKLTIILKLEDYDEEKREIEDAYLRIKIYDINNNQDVVNTFEDNIKVSDINEDFILQKIDDLKKEVSNKEDVDKATDYNDEYH